MNVNETLSRYSDLTYTTSVAVYITATILFLAAMATRPSKVQARRDARTAVSVGAAGSTTLDRNVPGKVERPVGRSREDRYTGAGFALAVLGVVFHAASIVLRGLATGRAPWGNMYEFVALTCGFGVLAALVVLRKRKYQPLLAFVFIPVIILMIIGGRVLYAEAGDVVPPLKSYWLVIHVSTVSLASGILLVSGVASLLYLAKMQWPRLEESDSAIGRIFARMAPAEVLDRFAYRTVVLGFPLFGLAVIFGAIWAEASWGRFWGWDPKETVSFITWIIYAAYLHARATAGWRNTAAAWVNVAAFVAMVFNLFIINYVVSGLHSYAGN